MNILGFEGTILAIFALGSQFTMFKIGKKMTANAFAFFNCIGILIAAIIITPAMGFGYTMNPFALLGGVLWAVGNLLGVRAVDKVGMAKGFPLWSAVIIILDFVLGVAFLGQIIANLYLAVLACLVLILGIYFIGKGFERREQTVKKSGMAFAALAGVFFAMQYAPMKFLNISPAAYFFPMALGIFLSGTVIFLLQREKIDLGGIYRGAVGGGIWMVGQAGAILAVVYLGLAVGPQLVNVCAVVSALWGVAVFKEVINREKKLLVYAGAVIVITGAALLTLSVL